MNARPLFASKRLELLEHAQVTAAITIGFECFPRP